MKEALTRAQQLGANCTACHFQDCQGPVYFKTKKIDPTYDFDIVLVGEKPTYNDLSSKEPLSGRDGWLLQAMLKELRIKYEQCHFTLSTLCSSDQLVDKKDWTQAINNCRPRLANELSPQQNRRQLVFLLGSKALQSVTGKDSIKAWRGFPIEPLELFDRKHSIYFPVYHPSMVRADPAYSSVWKLDFQRAIGYMQKKLQPVKWPATFVDENDQTFDALHQILKQVEKAPTDLGLDVETAGKEPLLVDLLCIGLAISDLAVCLPFKSANSDIISLWRNILGNKNSNIICHNGQHDILSLCANGINCDLGFDTLTESRLAFPKIDHDLGTCMTLTMFCPRHKSEYHKSGDLDTKGENAWGKAAKDPKKFRDMRIYCARDAWGGLMIKPFLQKIAGAK